MIPAAAALVAAAAGLFFLVPSDPGVDAELSSHADEAALALRAARAEGAARRAPVNLSHAEYAYAAGLLERRRQELRWAPLRDYDAAIGHFETSRERAARATELSQRSVLRDRAASSSALAGADAALARLAGVEDRIWLAEGARQQLQRARAMAAEAHAFAGAGAYAEAGERAREAERAAEGVNAALLASTSRFTEDEHLGMWRAWVDETVEWSRRTGRVALVVDKDAHVLAVYQGGRLLREYDAELGWNNVGDKFHEGDGATPEGRYKITQLKGRGRSRYYKALLLDYPNRDDLTRLELLKADGTLPRGTRPGGLIEVHGEGGRGKDWTDGCVAVTNAEMDWLFARVAVGTPVTIVGSVSGQGAFSDVARRMER